MCLWIWENQANDDLGDTREREREEETITPPSQGNTYNCEVQGDKGSSKNTH